MSHSAPGLIGKIVQKLGSENVIPFLGAGASAFAMGAQGARPPSGYALARALAEQTDGLTRLETSRFEEVVKNLALVASYYQKIDFTRPDLNNFLNQFVGDPAYMPNDLHRVIARAARRRPMLIMTTNYDELIERAFDNPTDPLTGIPEEPVPYIVVATSVEQLLRNPGSCRGGERGQVWCRQSSSGQRTEFVRMDAADVYCDLTTHSVIYKIHGSIRSGNLTGGYIIAEEDYARFLGRMHPLQIVPGSIKTLMGRQTQFDLDLDNDPDEPLPTFLFLGYGLHDWNLRVLLDELGIGRRPAEKEKHYAIMLDPNPVEKELLEQGRIKVIERSLEDFVTVARVWQQTWCNETSS